MASDQINDAARDNFTGQALFLRALFYLNLVVYYEDVPLITELQTLETAQVPKATQQEVLDQSIADLQRASDLLPPTQPEERFGHAAKGAAYGLLSHVYLYDGQWENAAKPDKDVIDLQQYDLTHSYKHPFQKLVEN